MILLPFVQSRIRPFNIRNIHLSNSKYPIKFIRLYLHKSSKLFKTSISPTQNTHSFTQPKSPIQRSKHPPRQPSIGQIALVHTTQKHPLLDQNCIQPTRRQSHKKSRPATGRLLNISFRCITSSCFHRHRLPVFCSRLAVLCRNLHSQLHHPHRILHSQWPF